LLSDDFIHFFLFLVLDQFLPRGMIHLSWVGESNQ
jgi:hypothetical protein